jgi:hypothetical protein
LVPILKPGQVLAMDNRPVHRSTWIDRLIEAAGCRVLQLLVQRAQHLATHPRPLGVFCRRLAWRKTRNMAVNGDRSRSAKTTVYCRLRYRGD